MYFSSMCWMRLLLMRWIRSGSCCLMKWETLPFYRGEDLCTLVTCTPYGVNTHRLLVRGHRVEYTEKTHGIRTGGRGADRSVDRRVGTGSSGICYPAGGSAYRTAVEKETEKERKVVHEL